MVFKKHGEEQYAREIIEREYAKDPGDPHLKTEIENLRKEDAQNLAPKEKMELLSENMCEILFPDSISTWRWHF